MTVYVPENPEPLLTFRSLSTFYLYFTKRFDKQRKCGASAESCPNAFVKVVSESEEMHYPIVKIKDTLYYVVPLSTGYHLEEL